MDLPCFPQFLERTLGYFTDPDVAFVQSPQAFFNQSFQHARGDDPIFNEQSLFDDVICRGKDRDNAAFWCGSSAVGPPESPPILLKTA